MKKIKIIKFLIFLLFLLVISSCSKIDKDKFSDLFSTANDTEAAIKVGVSNPDFRRLLQKYISQIDLVDSLSLKLEEKKLYQLFTELFEVYTHSLIAWNLDTEFTFENWPNFPREYIRYEPYPYYDNEQVLMTLVKLYDLEIEKANFNTISGEYPRSIDAVNRDKAIRKIWLRSSQIFSEIKKTYNE